MMDSSDNFNIEVTSDILPKVQKDNAFINSSNGERKGDGPTQTGVFRKGCVTRQFVMLDWQ